MNIITFRGWEGEVIHVPILDIRGIGIRNIKLNKNGKFDKFFADGVVYYRDDGVNKHLYCSVDQIKVLFEKYDGLLTLEKVKGSAIKNGKLKMCLDVSASFDEVANPEKIQKACDKIRKNIRRREDDKSGENYIQLNKDMSRVRVLESISGMEWQSLDVNL